MFLRRSRHAGFSLVELLIAFFVLLVGILAILVLFPLGLRESKTMVDASMAAFAARNARNLMETQPFVYDGDGQSDKIGHGTAGIVQIKFGPRGRWNSNTNQADLTVGSFPVMFPWEVLINNEDNGTFPLSLRPLDCATSRRDRVLEATNKQYSWDARFSIGGGIGTITPPGFPEDTGSSQDKHYIEYWFTQYYRYYAVQISVYRNYKEIVVGAGTVTLKPADGYVDTDVNRPLYSELVLNSEPDPDIMVGTAIRVRDQKSDWYKITAMTYDSGCWTFRLDRPYAGLPIGTTSGVSGNFSDVVATNTLLQSFTTILGSQLDDMDTSTLVLK